MYEQFASLDLGDRVSRDESKRAKLGANSEVYEGTLHPEQTKVAVKILRSGGDLSALREIEVSSLFALVSAMFHDNLSESTPRSSCLVQTRSRKCSQTTWDDNCFRSYDIYSVSIDVQRDCV